MYANPILHKNKHVHFTPHQLVPKLWDNRIQNINLGLKIRNLNFQMLDNRFVTQTKMRLKLSPLRSMLPFYTPWKYQETANF